MRISIHQCSIIVLCCFLGSCAERYELSARAMAFMTYHPGETFKLRVNGKDTLTYTVTQRKITKEIGSSNSFFFGNQRYHYEKGSTIFINDRKESSITIESGHFASREILGFFLNGKSMDNLVNKGDYLDKFNDGGSWIIDGTTYNSLFEYYDTTYYYSTARRIMYSKDLGLIYYSDSVFRADTLYSVTTLEYIP